VSDFFLIPEITQKEVLRQKKVAFLVRHLQSSKRNKTKALVPAPSSSSVSASSPEKLSLPVTSENKSQGEPKAKFDSSDTEQKQRQQQKSVKQLLGTELSICSALASFWSVLACCFFFPSRPYFRFSVCLFLGLFLLSQDFHGLD
jgi:hypothetical protein